MAFTLDEVAGSLAEGAEEAPRLQGQPASTPAESADTQLAAVMGELRWGMTTKQLVAVLQARVRADYARQIKAQRDILRQDELYQESKARYEAIKEGFVVFGTRKNGWDASQIAPEFRRGTHETMLWVKGERARDYYFFIDDRLWKWYRELDSDTRGSASFNGLAAMMQDQLGPAKFESVQRSEDAPVQPAATWRSSQTRVTLLNRGAAPCVILESQTVLAQLSVLRQDAQQRGPKRNMLLEGVIMDAAAREKWRDGAR